MSWASLLAQIVNNLPIILETQVWSLGQEDPLEKVMATHSSIPAWKIPWTEEPGGLQSMGSQRVGHDWKTNTFTFSFFWMSHRKDTKEAFPLRQQDFLYQRSLWSTSKTVQLFRCLQGLGTYKSYIFAHTGIPHTFVSGTKCAYRSSKECSFFPIIFHKELAVRGVT